MPDVTLRGGQAARIVTYRDEDGDGVELRDERAEGSNDKKADTDGDGISDFDELTLVRDIKTQRPGDPAVRGEVTSLTVKRRTSPVSADTDGDGSGDAAEIAAGTDPEVVDTDDDGARDGGDTAPLTVGPMIEYHFEGDSWLLDSQGGAALGPRAGCAAFNRPDWAIADRSGAPDRAIKTRPGDACSLLVRPSWATPVSTPDDPLPPRGLDSGAYTILAWAYVAPSGSIGGNKQRIQWLVGQPGGLIVELEEYDTVFAINVVQSNCLGNDVTCPAKAPFKLTLGGYSKQPAGQWLPIGLVVWPGKSGDTLGTNVRLLLAGITTESFAPDRAHGQTNGCVVLLGARSGSCDGSTRFTGGDTAPLGLPLDDVRVYRYALSDAQVAAAFAP